MHGNIFILTGKVQSGKSSWLKKLIGISEKQGNPIYGFICEGHFENGVRSGFSLVNVSDGSKYQLASVEIHDGWPSYGRFYFNPDTFQVGNSIIKEAIKNKMGPVILDELGPMELEGRGWSGLIELLIRETKLIQLWVVREQILARVMDRWEIPERNVFHVNRAQIENSLKRMIGHE